MLSFRFRVVTFLLGVCTTPLVPAAENLGEGAAAGLMAAGLLVFLSVVAGLFLFGLFLHAIFIHFAARIIDLTGTFGTAFKAAFLAWVLGLVLGFVGKFLAPFLSAPAVALMNLIFVVLGGTWAIQSAYHTGFFKALVTFVVTGLLTLIAVVVLYFLLMALLVGGAAATQTSRVCGF